MSKHVFVDLPNSINWPVKCAVCGSGSEKTLTKVDTQNSKTTGIPIPIPFLGAAYITRTARIDISYPACLSCAEKCRKAEFLSNKFWKVVAFALWLTVILALVAMLGAFPKWVYRLALFFVAVELILLVICALSSGKLPVRIHNFRKDSVELVFSSAIYAYEFVKLNKPYARPMSKVRSLIGLRG